MIDLTQGYHGHLRSLPSFTGIAEVLSIAVFGWYGMTCLLSDRMVGEFERFRLAPFRVLTGTLQVAASVGMIAGQFYRPLLLLCAGGLATMMLLAVITRIVIKDPLYAAIPALALFGINLFIFAAAW